MIFNWRDITAGGYDYGLTCHKEHNCGYFKPKSSANIKKKKL